MRAHTRMTLNLSGRLCARVCLEQGAKLSRREAHCFPGDEGVMECGGERVDRGTEGNTVIGQRCQESRGSGYGGKRRSKREKERERVQ